MILAFLHGVLFFFISIFIHILIVRVLGEKKLMARGVFFGILFLILFNLLPANGTSPFFSSLTYIFLWFMYLFILGCIANSVSIQLLYLMKDSKSESLTKDAIANLYEVDHSLTVRLQELSQNGFIFLRENERVEITNKGKILAAFFSSVRKFFFIGYLG